MIHFSGFAITSEGKVSGSDLISLEFLMGHLYIYKKIQFSLQFSTLKNKKQMVLLGV